MKALIPFVGFYESAHDADLDDAAQEMNVVDRDAISWPIVFQNYAKAYAEAFLDYIKVPGTFVDMHSPKEYNFSTDTIAVEVSEADMREAFYRAEKHGLADLVKQEMQERSGFIPYFSQDLDDWGPVVTWKEAQCELIFRVLAAEETTNGVWEQQDEIDLMEPARCNGKFEGWLYLALPNKDPEPMTKFDINVRLSYDGPVPLEQVRDLLLQALKEVRENGLLSEADWRDDPELSEVGCMSVELARPQVVIDMTDPDSFQFSGSSLMEVVCISRDHHDIEDAGEVKSYAETIGTMDKSIAIWPGVPAERAVVQSIECEYDPAVEKFFEALYKG